MRKAVKKARFKNIEVKKMKLVFKFRDYNEAVKYIFEGGNLGVEKFVGLMREH